MAAAGARAKASCTDPRGASTAADGGCDGSCDDSGGSKTPQAPSPHLGLRVHDPRLTGNWAAALSSAISGPSPPAPAAKRTSERRWSL